MSPFFEHKASPFVVAIPAAMIISMLIVSCTETKVTTTTVGDRSVVRVTAGLINAPNGDGRFYLVLRDPDTNTDYLAVQDAGIIELKPKPMKVEK